jgi:hypothetical protein
MAVSRPSTEAHSVFYVPAAHRVLAVRCSETMDMDRPNHCFSVYGQAFAAMANRRNFPVRSYYPKNAVLQAPDPRIVRIAKARGIFSNRVQHRLNLPVNRAPPLDAGSN